MKLLLDTHVFLWALLDPSKLSTAATDALQNSANQVYVSAITFWEISMKHSLGKLDLEDKVPVDLLRVAEERMGLRLLSLDPLTASTMGAVPRLHGDPFDRMLIHQSMAGGFRLVSADRAFSAYKAHGLQLLW